MFRAWICLLYTSNTPVTASSQSGHTVSARDTAGRTTSDSSSKPQLAHTGAEGVAGIAGVGAAALIAGAALMLLRLSLIHISCARSARGPRRR